jgi:hypothetical protein
MSNIFGSISHQDFLPPGYGDIETKVVQRVGVEDPSAGDAPSMEPMDDYAGIKDWNAGGIKDWKIFGGEGRSSSDTGTTGTVSAAPEVQAAPPPYRDCDNVKGYNYRQYADGKIEIRSGGLASSTQEGTRVGSQYQAAVTASIEAKCGPYPAGTTTTQDSVWASTLSSLGIDSGGSSASGGTQRGAAIGAGIGAFGAQLLPSLAAMLGPQETTIYDDEAPEMDVGGGGGAPWGLILGGVAVLGVLGVLGAKLAFSSTKDDDEE